MSLQVIWTTKFKKDYKLAIKRGYPIELLDNAIRLLAKNGSLPESYNDHSLSGNWKEQAFITVIQWLHGKKGVSRRIMNLFVMPCQKEKA